MFSVKAVHEAWTLQKTFAISRGAKTAADVIVVTVAKDGVMGRGEAVPYKHYGESVEGALAEIHAVSDKICDTQQLLTLMKPGAARNAVDAALIDYTCKTKGLRAWDVLKIKAPKPVITAFTLSMDAPQKMYEDAKSSQKAPLLKIKIGLEQGLEQIKAVRLGAPDAKLIVDANEALDLETLKSWMPELITAKVDLLEQPLKAGQDDALQGFQSGVPLCADESCRSMDDLAYLKARYDFINVKLDKTGGLTHGLEVVKRAQDLGLHIMIGCMVGTSLSMAPAFMLSPYADFVDLDGPLLMAKDRPEGMGHKNNVLAVPTPHLWG